MQHIKSLAAAVIMLVCAASCKKETVEPTASLPAIQKKVVEEKNLTNGDFKKYTYNAEGKVSKVESGTHSWSIEYQSTLIKVLKKRLTDNVSLGSDEYSIDASGRMISAVSRSAAGTVTYNWEFDYDAAGYMIRLKQTSSSGYTYEDIVSNPAGNPVRVTNYEDGALHDITDYYYNTDVKNIGTGTPLISYYGIKGFAGKIPQREISEFKRYDPSGVLTFHKINSFTTDSEGTIQKYNSAYPIQGLVHEWNVTYQ